MNPELTYGQESDYYAQCTVQAITGTGIPAFSHGGGVLTVCEILQVRISGVPSLPTDHLRLVRLHLRGLAHRSSSVSGS